MISVQEEPADTWLRVGQEASVLGGVQEPGVELAVWRRSLPADLTRWLEALPGDQLPDGRVLCGVDDLRAAVASLIAPAGASEPMRGLLIDDIEALARRFARLAGCEAVDVRLERVDDDGCAAFHRDCVPLRLLTTYRGRGTEWVEPRYASQALADRHDFAGPIRRLPEHAVALIRGCQAVDAAGLVHRSPPVDGPAAARLLLCLNTPSASSPAVWS